MSYFVCIQSFSIFKSYIYKWIVILPANACFRCTYMRINQHSFVCFIFFFRFCISWHAHIHTHTHHISTLTNLKEKKKKEVKHKKIALRRITRQNLVVSLEIVDSSFVCIIFHMLFSAKEPLHTTHSVLSYTIRFFLIVHIFIYIFFFWKQKRKYYGNE